MSWIFELSLPTCAFLKTLKVMNYEPLNNDPSAPYNQDSIDIGYEEVNCIHCGAAYSQNDENIYQEKTVIRKRRHIQYACIDCLVELTEIGDETIDEIVKDICEDQAKIEDLKTKLSNINQ